MTRIAFTPSPAPTPPRHAETPAGPTKADLPHGTKAKSSCRGDFRGQSYRSFERLNRPQMRKDQRSDWANALPPVWFLFVAGGAILFALLAVNAINSAFFDWMVTR
ncbi:hypothetical protein [uncultured Ruegeria sp.]|uniref:hypothetical protein n=1 Tax=uncultured Ruegeria sp. TaxID=259304 RepID=UPI00260DD847|nr:hypothetical protein [uncultured Ruegeria sp.]